MSYGQIYLNGVNYSGSHVEPNPTIPTGATVTPMSNVKIDDDYFSVSGGGGGGGTSSDNYSTTEHVVGTWIDNTSPVYEKTINVASHNGGSQIIDNTLTMDDITYITLKEIGFIVNNTYMDGTQMGIELVANANGINIDSNNSPLNSFPLTDIYITIRYVKNI